MAYLAHSIDYIILRNGAASISVELVEDCLQHSVIQELLHIQSRHQELRVVYFFVALVIHLVYYLLNLFVRDVDVTRLDCFFKFTRAD